jgi:hypothetical protein
MFQTPTTQVWKRLYDEGALRPPQTLFWEPKPSEELYDLENDPWEVNNLAGSASHQEVLARMREALDAHTRGIRDVGFLPEYELHRDEQVRSTWERAQDPAAYDFDRVYEMAVAAAALDLERLLEDPEPGPRIVAAEALARFGSATQRDRAIAVLLDLADASRQREYVATFALYSLTQVPNLPRPVIDAVRLLPDEPTVFPGDLAQRQPVLVKLVAAALAGNH